LKLNIEAECIVIFYHNMYTTYENFRGNAPVKGPLGVGSIYIKVIELCIHIYFYNFTILSEHDPLDSI